MVFWLAILMACTPSVETVVSSPLSSVEADFVETELTYEVSVTDEFSYEQTIIDVLYVLDTSGSMTAASEVLIGSLSAQVVDWTARGFDFQAGATSIDEGVDHGKLTMINGNKWADNTLPNPGMTLEALAHAVDDPSPAESGRAAAYKALQMTAPGAYNDGFLRDGSELAVIVHTDESDQSGPNPVTQQEFIDYLLELRDPDRVSFHSIAASQDYLEVTQAVGGVQWGVDNTPYGPALRAMSDTFDQMLFTLSEVADEASIEVLVIEPDFTEVVLVPDEYSYDAARNTVELTDYGPEVGATIEITYVILD